MEKAIITLDVSESKRLIAKGVKELSMVQAAMDEGLIIVSLGTGNAYVLEELSGQTIEKEKFAAGITCEGRICVTPAENRPQPVVLKNGEITDIPWTEALKEFSQNDVFIKGANAFDADGNIGILLASREGGTIGAAISTIVARGANLLFPIGLEKLLPSIKGVSNFLGTDVLTQGMGMNVGMMEVNYGDIITELDALNILTDLEAIPVAAGGIGGSEGSQTILLMGDNVQEALAMVKSIKGELPLKAYKRKCPCAKPCIL